MQWVCDFCGYIHDDGKPPEVCPVCGESRSRFSERYVDEDTPLDDQYSAEGVDDPDDYFDEYDE